MQKKSASLLPTALVLLILATFLFLGGSALSRSLSQLGLSSASRMMQGGVFFVRNSFSPKENKKQDTMLTSIAAKAGNDQESGEIKALRDQFQTESVQSSSLLPTMIIGFEGYIPGVSRPTEIVIDRGEKDGLHAGQAVIYKDNLLGKVTKTDTHRSLVDLLTKSGWSFTAKTSATGANGLVSVEDGNIFLQNVVLSDKLSKNDLVVTKGDESFGDAGGFPPGLVIGEITSIDKKASSLFQTAKVRSFINVTTLTTVFVSL